MTTKKFFELVKLISNRATYHNKAAQLWQYGDALMTVSGDWITIIINNNKVYRINVKTRPNKVEALTMAK